MDGAQLLAQALSVDPRAAHAASEDWRSSTDEHAEACEHARDRDDQGKQCVRKRCRVREGTATGLWRCGDWLEGLVAVVGAQADAYAVIVRRTRDAA